MKPTKNWNYCPDCGRKKMLFESELKVKTFIKFNGQDVADAIGVTVEDLRPYYCVACGGWHFSSKKKFNGKTRTDVAIKQMDSIENGHYSISEIYNICDELRAYNPNKDKHLNKQFFNIYYPNLNKKTHDRIITMFYQKAA